MPANADALGIGTCAHTLAQKVSVSRKAEPVSPLLDKDGAFSQGATIGDDGDFSIEGKGDVSFGFDDAPSSDLMSGVILVTDIEESEDAKDWNSWNVNGQWCPSAT